MREIWDPYTQAKPTFDEPIRRKSTCTQPLQKESSLNSKIQANASPTVTQKQRAKRRVNEAHRQGGGTAAVEAMAVVSMARPLQIPARKGGHRWV